VVGGECEDAVRFGRLEFLAVHQVRDVRWLVVLRITRPAPKRSSGLSAHRSRAHWLSAMCLYGPPAERAGGGGGGVSDEEMATDEHG